MISEREKVRAMLNQALAEARTQRASRVTALHLVVYDASQEMESELCQTLRALSVGTPAEAAQVIIHHAPSRFICWNCCGLRFVGDGPQADCPNCGHAGWLVPAEITFALDRTELAW